ncbi:MAG: hypothetical protein A2735_00370 [Candidatus Yanofskybacteria bacterium RIFCSPHIGHO2_01_FULL_41_21]|uniref:CSD domain-containing protein n=1 Tax=Candidatus Yanofskybacteria bacterium RIFCSPHIGHO2_01_FULL_41_21 TaxID=1802660 RepID=A0A1F8EDH5_9BACT|nr:MAG: hypothetical protein A2735_00370 [Candidatus Yanofskybacteria bacterium RIFCSPHIGHO2_01_FULL_41_21]
MQNGTIKRLVMEKGFGFITPDDKSILPAGKEDLFFHNSGVVEGTIDALKEGQRVSFEVDNSDPVKGIKAVSVKGE